MRLCRMTGVRASAVGRNRHHPSHHGRLAVTTTRDPSASTAARWQSGPEGSKPPVTSLPHRPPAAEGPPVRDGTDTMRCHDRSGRPRVCFAAVGSARALAPPVSPRRVLRVTATPFRPRVAAWAIAESVGTRHRGRPVSQPHPLSCTTVRMPGDRRNRRVREDGCRTRAQPLPGSASPRAATNALAQLHGLV
jgi:hypothetical protein